MSAAKRYRRGLVVGKFCPLHRGHMLVIQSALEACDEVVVISYTNPEFDGCGKAQREAWLGALFPQVRALVIDDESLRAWCVANGFAPIQLPLNDAADAVQRGFTGWLCWTMLRTTVDAVFTSEGYGDGFAQAMSAYFAARTLAPTPVQHVNVDMSRSAVPISGTSIRADPQAHRDFMDPRVYASLVKPAPIDGGVSFGIMTSAVELQP